MTGRAFLITLPLYGQDERDFDALLNRQFEPTCIDNIRYAVWQLEQAPSTNLLHWQSTFAINQVCEVALQATSTWRASLRALCFLILIMLVITVYVELNAKVRPTSVANQIEQEYGVHPHVEIARDRAKAEEYCQKADTRVDGPFRHGSSTTQQGKRNDLLDVQAKLRAGSSLLDIANDHFGSWCRYNKSFAQYQQMLLQPRDFKTFVTVLVGPPGCGKTRFCHDDSKAHGMETYMKPKDKWWDLYTADKSCVLDDFYGWYPYDDMLRLLDRYEMLIQNKGGMLQFRSKRLYITSNKPPGLWYSAEVLSKYDFRAFIRRIDRFIFMNADGTFAYDGNDYDLFLASVGSSTTSNADGFVPCE